MSQVLRGLTYIEQLLIAKVQLVTRIYRVKSRDLLGQFTYKGNITDIGRNINQIVHCLLRISP